MDGGPQLPAGVDQAEYQKLRYLMWASVQAVWRGGYEVVAGMDPWSVVDEAWSSMAANGFECQGPFRPFACRVARNKAVDALRRAEVRRLGPSLDAPIPGPEGTQLAVEPAEGSSASAEAEYFAAQRLAGINEAILYSLSSLERLVFFGVRVDRKSRAAVGRELDPPLTGQRVGQILAAAVVKIHDALRENHRELFLVPDSGKGGVGNG